MTVQRDVAPIGLMSVTFRALSPTAIVELAAGAGCICIGWSGDVHVPTGASDRAEVVRARTEDAGMQVESYGSYWRGAEAFEPWLDAAVALGAGRIRIWAGESASHDVDAGERARLAERIARAADAAARHDIELALEFHRRTSTDTLASTLALLDAIADRRCSSAPAVRSLWQPRHGIDPDEAVGEIRALGARLAAVHVFAWTSAGERRPLREGEAVWRPVLAAIRELPQVVPLLLEFVVDDDPVQFVADVATLRDWFGGDRA